MSTYLKHLFFMLSEPFPSVQNKRSGYLQRQGYPYIPAAMEEIIWTKAEASFTSSAALLPGFCQLFAKLFNFLLLHVYSLFFLRELLLLVFDSFFFLRELLLLVFDSFFFLR